MVLTKEDFHKRPTLNARAEEEEERQLPLPKEIGGYKIESLLNRGGMSLLYLGIHPETGEPLTIKVLSAQYLTHSEMVDRFLKEAEIVELTSHPNIVRLYGHGRWEGGVYIAMEFVQGLTLREIILQQSLSLKRALEIVLQIGHAIAHFHSLGIIHRDLKPENILLTASGGIKVIDFGIAALFAEGAASEKARLVGTPVYMSPEQREDPAHATFATDIYALGILTYELVLGRLSHGVIHLSLVPKGLQNILAKALQPNPSDRYDDIIAFIRDIAAYLTSDELKRDMRGSDYLGELSQNLKEAQALLVPTEAPQWPHMEIGLACNSSMAISSVYYDFFSPRNGVYAVILAESIATGVEGLLSIALLKGMLRALLPLYERPAAMVKELNQRIIEEGKERSYALSMLLLFSGEEKLSYISCGYSPLWQIGVGATLPRRLKAENVALGITPDLEVLEVDANWRIGDLLVLHTFQAGLSKSVMDIEGSEAFFAESLMQSHTLPPKRQAELLFRKIARGGEGSLLERPLTIISIGRLS